MYLEKLEIQGFKSFATKNVLVFPGMLDKTRQGITSIVGPNGSGKSNIADAVRWVLGEQSMKTLRGKKSEDIIFAGSEKLGKLGMAEVSLFLNNEDRKAPIDYSQIVLTRRVYRDGNSEYILNNNRVRLLDVEMLLAKANFGQKTYSVIGQGMVDGFLNTSLAERKEFFDEATGVKQFQIKRDSSLNKLKLSLENLAQAQMLLVEIEPRLKSLTRQVGKLQRKGEIEFELREIQLNYYGKIWHEIKDKFNEANRQFLEMEKIKIDKDKKLGNLNRELGVMEAENQTSREFNDWQRELSDFQSRKDGITREQARLEAQMEIKLETSGQFDLSWLNNRKSLLSRELATIKEELESLAGVLREGENNYSQLLQERNGLSLKINGLNASLVKNSSSVNGGDSQKINRELRALILKLEQADAEDDLAKLKEVVKEIREELKKLTGLAEDLRLKEDIEKIQNDLMAFTKAREEVSEKMNENAVKNSSWGERKKMLSEKMREFEKEFLEVGAKLKTYQNQISDEEIEAGRKKLAADLAAVEQKIGEVRAKINDFSEKEKEKRQRLFELQKKMQILQGELNDINERLNSCRVESAKHEIKLEDLEMEIRNELGSLKEVEQKIVSGAIDVELIQNKIHNLKKQLDAIGGLDPEIEKEYIQTKDRFDFLDGQVADLTSTIDSLDEVVKELDITIKERFDREFKLISQKFEEYFKILFSGGAAKIIKVTTDELMTEEEKQAGKGELGDKVGEERIENIEKKEDVIDERIAITNAIYKKIKMLQKYNATGLAGVEITATPPGKKTMSVSLLSGGERALTAIALICAIISANPAPFVVLDEVDAALDEANSERLAKILDDLSHKTQFIVITHNRASMRRANILYGVTMQNDGVSKMLSVKLEDVKARNET